MTLYITLYDAAYTPKTKGFINKLLSNMGYLVRYNGEGVIVSNLETSDQLEEIRTVLQPLKNKYGDSIMFTSYHENEAQEDFDYYKRERKQELY